MDESLDAANPFRVAGTLMAVRAIGLAFRHERRAKRTGAFTTAG